MVERRWTSGGVLRQTWRPLLMSERIRERIAHSYSGENFTDDHITASRHWQPSFFSWGGGTAGGPAVCGQIISDMTNDLDSHCRIAMNTILFKSTFDLTKAVS